MLHLSLSEQFQTIQSQARLETIAEESKNPAQTIPLSEITLSDIITEILSSIQGLKKSSDSTLTVLGPGCRQCITKFTRMSSYARLGDIYLTSILGTSQYSKVMSSYTRALQTPLQV